MRLAGKTLAMLVADGVDQEECDTLRMAFEREGGTVLIASSQEFTTVETVAEGKRGRDLVPDLPFSAIAEMPFDGLVIPDGLLSSEELRTDRRVIDLVFTFHRRGLPIFASGNAVQVLYESDVLSEQVVVREGSPLASFIDRAVLALADAPSVQGRYRPAAA